MTSLNDRQALLEACPHSLLPRRVRLGTILDSRIGNAAHSALYTCEKIGTSGGVRRWSEGVENREGEDAGGDV
jgi:hypothetical protein